MWTLVAVAAILGAATPFAGGQAPAGAKVVGGPYVVNVRAQSATVMWLVESGQAGLGTAPNVIEKTAPALHAERVNFSGLRPGATYYYDSFGGDAGKGSFKTPPAGPAQFEFVVYGDTRTRHDVHRSVIAAILKYAHPDFVMHTGDLVADGNDTSLWPIFFDVERELLRKAAFYPSLGNHERNAKNYSSSWMPGHTTRSTGAAPIASSSTATSEMPAPREPRRMRSGKPRHAGSRKIFATARKPASASCSRIIPPCPR